MLFRLCLVSILVSTLRRKRVQPQYSIRAHSVCSHRALPALPAEARGRGAARGANALREDGGYRTTSMG